MTEKRCFFGSFYSGRHCKCGWSKEMIKEVPREYLLEGNVKFYVVNSYNNRTVYGCDRNKQRKTKSPPKHLKAGKFIVWHANNKVETKEDTSEGVWSKLMEEYLNNALVKKEGKNLICIGVSNKNKQKQTKGVYGITCE